MTRDEAKQMLPIIQAYAEGKTIEVRDIEGTWSGKKEYELKFDCHPANYRIKPEPKYRPFKLGEECWNEMLQHQPFGWLRRTDEEGAPGYEQIYSVISGSLLIEDNDIDSGRLFQSVMGDYTFADGTPFGIKVEEDEQ